MWRSVYLHIKYWVYHKDIASIKTDYNKYNNITIKNALNIIKHEVSI